MESQKKLRVFVRSPDLVLPSRALTLAPDLTLRRLKLAFLPQSLLSQALTIDSLYFSLNGKPLPDDSSLAAAGVPDFSALTLRLRLRGGGGDGGATGAESRDCYLNMYAIKKPDKVDPNETRLSKWTTCALSAEPLSPPCVIDRLGNLFNKEPLVEALLHKKLPKEFSHVRGLKDMIPIHLTPIPSAAVSETKFQCPITGQEFNGKYGFLAIRGCGHVLSVKALKEVKSSTCLVCHKEFSDMDKIVINGSAEEVRVLREKMEEERGRLKVRKEKKVGACLSGTKHANDEKGGILDNGKKDGRAKRFKAVDVMPTHATKEVYASIFTSSKKSDFKETFTCRSLPLGRN
ncbi:replication termination factor 2-like [Phoenix dactylifera]|uniref:Replication termination factor 2-like n=1 Tax=Phoenix dactylifera TaxID=42345 RepID=A0A8B7C9B5_PHODC|nr:replication termination factor 2-like [Phoenix dactylifera]